MRILSLAPFGVLFAGAFGCGLINSDITKVSFDLPTKTYSFDSSTLNIPAGNSTAVPCGGTALVADCCNPPPPFPAPDCSMPTTKIDCSPNGQAVDVCTAHVTLTQSAPMNLGQEVPVLSSATSLGNLSINQISYAVPANTLNVDLPPVTIYLAPQGAAADASQRMKFGTVPAIPAGTTPSGTVVLESTAAGTFSYFTRDLSVPFSFITEAIVDVPSGSPTPSGAITIQVTGRLSASL